MDFNKIKQMLMGGGSKASPVDEAQAETRYHETQEKRVDSAAGMVEGKGIMPDGEVTDFESDSEPRSDSDTPA